VKDSPGTGPGRAAIPQGYGEGRWAAGGAPRGAVVPNGVGWQKSAWPV